MDESVILIYTRYTWLLTEFKAFVLFNLVLSFFFPHSLFSCLSFSVLSSNVSSFLISFLPLLLVGGSFPNLLLSICTITQAAAYYHQCLIHRVPGPGRGEGLRHLTFLFLPSNFSDLSQLMNIFWSWEIYLFKVCQTRSLVRRYFEGFMSNLHKCGFGMRTGGGWVGGENLLGNNISTVLRFTWEIARSLTRSPADGAIPVKLLKTIILSKNCKFSNWHFWFKTNCETKASKGKRIQTLLSHFVWKGRNSIWLQIQWGF